MKYMKRSEIYKGSNVTFDPELIEARSYDHWVFVAKIDGKVIFNNYAYSPTTQGHQRKVRSLLDDLGIQVDICVETSKSLNDYDWKHNCIVSSKESIKQLEKLEAKGRKETWASDNRLLDIDKYKCMIRDVKQLG